MNFKRIALLPFIGAIFLLSCSEKKTSLPVPEKKLFASYEKSIQPIFNRRCAVCHSCNDAPCQLDTTAFEGVDRGASVDEVYADRLFSMDPVRLFIDAQTTEQWREKGFFPVIHHHGQGDSRNLDHSILYKLLEYRQKNPLPKMRFDAFGSRNCPDLQATIPKLRTEIASMFNMEAHSDLGMPYGFPRLSEEEFQTIRDWLLRGSPGPEKKSEESNPETMQVTHWESFFNRSEPKHQLVSRYLYEHFFYAHLYFQKSGPETSRRFYRLVRSRTPAPQAIDEIAVRLPYESPRTKEYYYRLKPIEATIVHKTHLPFELSAEVETRWTDLFFSDDWQISAAELPEIGNTLSANPFVIFQKIPAKSRYRFLIENAGYFVATFMKGPVCRGQLALNVIDDHFFLFFLHPESDPSVNNPEVLKRGGKYLITPFRSADLFSGESGSGLWTYLELPGKALEQLRQEFYPYYKSRQLKYLKIAEEYQAKARPNGWSLADIWDGDGENYNAVLTVFRHHDSASVSRGAWGGVPKTTLVLDYPIFERMYYDLVASFDIYSDIKVQLSTRLYMDDLRIEAEDLFLSFLPQDKRRAVRNYWYRAAEDKINNGDYPLPGTEDGIRRDTQIAYQTKNPKAEFVKAVLIERIKNHLGGIHDSLNQGNTQEKLPDRFRAKTEAELQDALQMLGGRSGAYLTHLPDLSFLRFHGRDGKALVYTFIRNRAHLNVKYLFGEESRLAEKEDTLTILSGFEGSYPNLFFDIPMESAGDFLSDFVAQGQDWDKWKKFVKEYGVLRQDERFWELSDFFTQRFLSSVPIAAGLFDLSRYENY